MELIILNKPAPDWMRDAFKQTGSSGMLRLSDQMIMLKIDDFTLADLKGLRGKVQVRVYRGRSVLSPRPCRRRWLSPSRGR